jgi:hypothetical protein
MWQRLKQVDWTFLAACIGWGLTTVLMLYVKLRKKTESFPVLILVGIFLLYMNSGDLFKSFRLYTIACVNRRVLIHQFIAMTVFGFLSNCSNDIFVVALLMAAILLRPGWSLGQTGLPALGAFLVKPLRRTLVALGLAAQCFGFFTGTVLGVAMIDSSATISFNDKVRPVESRDLSLILGLVVVMLSSALVKLTRKTRGQITTVLGSALIAAISRVIPIYSSPLSIVPVIAVVNSMFPEAVTSIATFIPQLMADKTSSKSFKVRVFLSVVVLHALGALAAGYASPSLYEAPEYVSRKAIAQELFYSTILSFIVPKRPSHAPLVYLAAYLGTAGHDMVHLSSSISFGAEGLGNGRLLARLIWQSVGGLIGSCLLAHLADSDKIDFDPITSVTRTTDGRVIAAESRATGR